MSTHNIQFQNKSSRSISDILYIFISAVMEKNSGDSVTSSE